MMIIHQIMKILYLPLFFNKEYQLYSVQQDGQSIKYITNPSEAVQLSDIKNIDEGIFEYFMDRSFNKIDSSKVLNLLYKKAPEKFKEQIKSHPNYKTDAKLVLENIR